MCFRSIRLPIGGKDRTMISLQELLCRVDTAPAYRGKKVTTQTIRDSHAKVVESLSTHDGSLLQVFENGYILYQSGCRRTVFHISLISNGYSYPTVGIWNRQNMFIPMSELLKMPWYFAVLMVAEDMRLLIGGRSFPPTGGLTVLFTVASSSWVRV